MFLKNLYLLLFLQLCLLTSLRGQSDSVYYTENPFNKQLEDLRANYGKEKTIPAAYETAVLVALSHYPELVNTPIEFVDAPITATMMARPRTNGILDGRSRSYIIYINNRKENTGFLPSELTFNQFTGVMGHELAHVCYYTGRTAFHLFLDGMGYYFKDYRRSFEAGTDMITMDHGLGWQLIDFSQFIMTCNHLSPAYAKKKRTTYLGNHDLRLEIEKRMATEL